MATTKHHQPDPRPLRLLQKQHIPHRHPHQRHRRNHKEPKLTRQHKMRLLLPLPRSAELNKTRAKHSLQPNTHNQSPIIQI